MLMLLCNRSLELFLLAKPGPRAAALPRLALPLLSVSVTWAGRSRLISHEWKQYLLLLRPAYLTQHNVLGVHLRCSAC